MSHLIFRRTLAPSDNGKRRILRWSLRRSGIIPISVLARFQLSIIRWTLFLNAYHKIRGVMKREIFLYGHFGDCFSLGRNVCPDDLVKNMQSKKQEPMAPVFLCHDDA